MQRIGTSAHRRAPALRLRRVWRQQRRRGRRGRQRARDRPRTSPARATARAAAEAMRGLLQAKNLDANQTVRDVAVLQESVADDLPGDPSVSGIDDADGDGKDDDGKVQVVVGDQTACITVRGQRRHLRVLRFLLIDAMLRIGTSGWQYRDWRGRFYPKSVPAARWLEHYAARFATVEVNNTFYRLPAPATFERVERACARRLRNRRQGEPLPDALQAVARSGRTGRAPHDARARAGCAPRAGAAAAPARPPDRAGRASIERCARSATGVRVAVEPRHAFLVRRRASRRAVASTVPRCASRTAARTRSRRCGGPRTGLRAIARRFRVTSAVLRDRARSPSWVTRIAELWPDARSTATCTSTTTPADAQCATPSCSRVMRRGCRDRR